VLFFSFHTSTLAGRGAFYFYLHQWLARPRLQIYWRFFFPVAPVFFSFVLFYFFLWHIPFSWSPAYVEEEEGGERGLIYDNGGMIGCVTIVENGNITSLMRCHSRRWRYSMSKQGVYLRRTVITLVLMCVGGISTQSWPPEMGEHIRPSPIETKFLLCHCRLPSRNLRVSPLLFSAVRAVTHAYIHTSEVSSPTCQQ